MKQILYLCHRIPFPPNKGDKIRSFNILDHLAQKHTISLSCLVDTPKDLQYISAVKKIAKITLYDGIYQKQRKIFSTIKAFIKSKPISVPFFYSQKLQNDIDNFLASNPVDTILCSSSPSAEYIFRSRHYRGFLQNAQWIMDFIDMDSQKWQQIATIKRFPSSFIYQREAHYLLEFEKQIAREFNQLLIVSDAEKILFQSLIPTEKIHAVSNGVDLEFFHPRHLSKINLLSPALVFTGAMDYWPNIKGAVWFVHKILPRIHTVFPDACLYIVGSNPAPELQRLAKHQNVIITGFVDDIRDYIIKADICVIPLQVARGIQNKVLEAMAMGKAVVSTPEAAEGLTVHYGNDISIQKDEISFANAVIALLQDKNAAQRLGKNARKAVEKNYSWKKALSLLDALIDS